MEFVLCVLVCDGLGLIIRKMPSTECSTTMYPFGSLFAFHIVPQIRCSGVRTDGYESSRAVSSLLLCLHLCPIDLCSMSQDVIPSQFPQPRDAVGAEVH